ncbi:MAG: hypothetical protein IJ659_02580 [Alloprevotella sp.]|nr:hypothetical protein [Alloprevotella sp.]
MHFISRISLVLLAASLSLGAAAQKNTKEFTGIHVFGVGTSFNDSTVYISQPQFLPEATLQAKTRFMENRAKYAFQMKTYLEANYAANETCAVFYAKTHKTLEKKYLKVRRRLLKRGVRIVEMPASEFAFQFIPAPGQQTITNTSSKTSKE